MIGGPGIAKETIRTVCMSEGLSSARGPLARARGYGNFDCGNFLKIS